MGYYCTVPQCTSLAGKTKNVKFHRFPRDEFMADKWNSILKRGKPYTKYSKVCSLHFTQSDYNITTMGQWKTLSKDAVPTQNLPKLNPDGTVMVIRKSRTVKYRDPSAPKKDREPSSDKGTPDKWAQSSQMVWLDTNTQPPPSQEASLNYRLQALSSLASSLTQSAAEARRKQDATMQTDPVSEDDYPATFSEASNHSDGFGRPPNRTTQPDDANERFRDSDVQTDRHAERDKPDDRPADRQMPDRSAMPDRSGIPDRSGMPDRHIHERQDPLHDERLVHQPKDYTKSNDYEALKFDRKEVYQKFHSYPKTDVYGYRNEVYSHPVYQNGFNDPVEMMRSQHLIHHQHLGQNQNFFNENQIKQEIANEDDKFMFDRSKDLAASGAAYGQTDRAEPVQQVKCEPDAGGRGDSVQENYYQANGTNPGYYEQFPRPGPELLIAKQNALAAQTQLWQNTMKRPFFYSENPTYNGSQLMHKYEDLSRILQ